MFHSVLPLRSLRYRRGHSRTMVDKTKTIVGDRLKNVVADGGYLSILDLKAARERNIQLVAHRCNCVIID